MELEEIRKIFLDHGLDPELVKIYETVYRPSLHAREYRFDYPKNGGCYDYHFLIPIEWEKDSSYMDLMIRAFVVKGVRKLCEQTK